MTLRFGSGWMFCLDSGSGWIMGSFFLSGIRNLEQCRLSGIMSSKELNGKFWYNLLTKTCQKLKIMNINMLIWTGTQTDELKTNFDQDSFFQRIDFTLNSHDRDKELSILIGDYRRLD